MNDCHLCKGACKITKVTAKATTLIDCPACGGKETKPFDPEIATKFLIQYAALTEPHQIKKAHICGGCEHLILNRRCPKFGNCRSGLRDFYRALQREQSKCPIRKWSSDVFESEQ